MSIVWLREREKAHTHTHTHTHCIHTHTRHANTHTHTNTRCPRKVEGSTHILTHNTHTLHTHTHLACTRLAAMPANMSPHMTRTRTLHGARGRQEPDPIHAATSQIRPSRLVGTPSKTCLGRSASVPVITFGLRVRVMLQDL
jgi:hypothetical protein